MLKLYTESLSVFHRAFTCLEGVVEPPVKVKLGSDYVYRYQNQSIKAAILQKLARVISGIEASLVLLEKGFLQELCVIFRTLDEFNQDILFLCETVEKDQLSELHQRFLDIFYQEEFDKPDNPFLSEQNRPSIPRQKIQAEIAKIFTNEISPSNGQEVFRTLSKGYSGYVHGASSHIMEMYGGNPPKFHLSGMRNTPLFQSSFEDTWNYFYRSLLSMMRIAQVFNMQELSIMLKSFRDHFEEQFDQTEWVHPEKSLKNLKHSNVQK